MWEQNPTTLQVVCALQTVRANISRSSTFAKSYETVLIQENLNLYKLFF